MIKHWKFGAKIIIFTVIMAILIAEVNYVLTPKKYFDNTWPTTSAYKGFYQMQENSIDVLYFGSSHTASGICPQVVYNNYGIRSYNLGCEQQNILVSYYWLKEALKYQTPKVVVLDTYMLFEYNHVEALNTAESCTRMAMDAMKWSDNKHEAIRAICENDDNQTYNSYLFKNIRFHTRWTSLSEQDFTFNSMEEHYELKGYTALVDRGKNVYMDYQPYSDFDRESKAEMKPLMQEYLNKIYQLCKDENIQLLLVKTPSTEWNTYKHNTVQDYADENGILFLDFNTSEVYNQCGFVYSEDMHDNGHANIWGAEKMSLYLASIIYEKYEVGGGEYFEQWSDTNDYYERVFEDCELKYLTDLDEYIDAINKDRYTVLIATQYDMTGFMNDDAKTSFGKLGLDVTAEQFDGYYAAISDYNTVQAVGHDTLRYSGSTRNKMIDFSILSGGWDAGSACSITINNVEYAKKWNGLNIVVYSNEMRKVVDSVVYNGSLNR